MDGLNNIMKSLKEMMGELFDGVEEQGGVYRSHADHIGVTDISVIVEAVLEGGVNEEAPYPIIHFHTTIAANIPEEYADELNLSLGVLNNVISVGEFPSFGCFCYYPRLRQIYLTYRMPVNPEAPDAEIVNIQYYLGVLYDELDAFGDYIMFLCDNEGRSPGIEEYLKYLKEIDDWNDIAARAEELEKILENSKAALEKSRERAEKSGKMK